MKLNRVSPAIVRRYCSRRVPLFTLLLLLLAIHAFADAPRLVVEKAPEYERLFLTQSQWNGGDGAYSVPLPGNDLLWLFGDSWIGPRKIGPDIPSFLIHNSIALERGTDPLTASIRFFYDKRPDGTPQAFLSPPHAGRWFWFLDGISTSKGLYLFLLEVQRAEGPPGFNFRILDNWVARVENPRAPPPAWRVTRRRIPWARFGPPGNRFFGSALLREKGFIYLYGVLENAPPGENKGMILARIRGEDPMHFSDWRFYDGGRWVGHAAGAVVLSEHMAVEYSVSYLPGLEKYMALFTEDGLSPNILARLAPTPNGPWGDPLLLYRCPEAKENLSIYCYGAKAHPSLSTNPNEAIITYVANSGDLLLITRNPRLYRPIFLRLRVCGPSR